MATEYPLSIGGITLDQWDTPEILSDLGGHHNLVVHDFPGGLRIAQTFGAFDSDISFTGVLYGQGAVDRAQALDALRTTGKQTMLQWNSFEKQGIVKKCKIDVSNAFEVHYTLDFQPLQASAPGGSYVPQAASLNSAITQAINKIATPPITGSVSDMVQEKIAEVNQQAKQALQGAGNKVSQIPPDVAKQVQNAINTARTMLQGEIGAGADDATQSNYSNLDAILQNMYTIFDADTPKTISLPYLNPNLSKISAAQYGSTQYWPIIAEANNTLDNVMTGLVWLNIPLTAAS